MDRKQKALCGITKSMRGLEIGPSYQPVAAKREGWNVQIVDHIDRESLRKKYGDCSVDVDAIEEVDFICPDNDFLSAVPKEAHGTYDYIVSAHMIEHTPDLIQYLSQMEELLAPNGILSLIVPDKLYCFDFFRPLSTTADVLYANYQKRQRHSIRTAFEMEAYYTRRYGRDIWGESSHDMEGFVLPHTVARAYQAFSNLSDAPTGEYRDFHCWKFTPASFRLILLELQLLEKTGFSVIKSFPTQHGEFVLQLGRCVAPIPAADTAEAQAMRLVLLQEIQKETIAALVAPPPEVRSTFAVRAIKSLLPDFVHPPLARAYHWLRAIL